MGMTLARLQDAWFAAVNDFARATPALHAPIRFFALYGVVLFAALLVASWWVARAHGVSAGPPLAGAAAPIAAAVWAPVGVLLALAVNQPLVHLVREPRPYMVHPHVLLLVAHSSDYAFPSDHAVMAGAVAAGVLLADRRLGSVAAAAALAMAFARVYVGAHYPLDVATGLVLGSAFNVLGFLLLRPLLIAGILVAARTPLRACLTSTPADPQERAG
jgi:membrane-associated phospholipid phosphatase